MLSSANLPFPAAKYTLAAGKDITVTHSKGHHCLNYLIGNTDQQLSKAAHASSLMSCFDIFGMASAKCAICCIPLVIILDKVLASHASRYSQSISKNCNCMYLQQINFQADTSSTIYRASQACILNSHTPFQKISVGPLKGRVVGNVPELLKTRLELMHEQKNSN